MLFFFIILTLPKDNFLLSYYFLNSSTFYPIQSRDWMVEHNFPHSNLEHVDNNRKSSPRSLLFGFTGVIYSCSRTGMWKMNAPVSIWIETHRNHILGVVGGKVRDEVRSHSDRGYSPIGRTSSKTFPPTHSKKWFLWSTRNSHFSAIQTPPKTDSLQWFLVVDGRGWEFSVDVCYLKI